MKLPALILAFLIWSMILWHVIAETRGDLCTSRIDAITCRLAYEYRAGRIPDEQYVKLFTLRTLAHRAAIRNWYNPSTYNAFVERATMAQLENALCTIR